MYGTASQSSTERAASGPEAVSACSACAGNYEDPERTAPPRQANEELPEGQGADGIAWTGDAMEED